MSAIYLTQHGTHIKKDGGKLTIHSKTETPRHFPITYADTIVVMAHVQITYEATIAILQNGGTIIYLDKTGAILGELGSNNRNTRQSLRQLKTYLNDTYRLQIAAAIINKKIIAQRNLINIKNKTLKNPTLKTTAATLHKLAQLPHRQPSIEKIMGIEGIASKHYFTIFDILYADTPLKWNGRQRRPAKDPINSMLNFCYALLEKDVRRAISTAGLDPNIGFLHALDLRKDSLVYDLMEPFRITIADRFVMRCLSWKIFQQHDFHIVDGACYLQDDARSKLIAQYETYVGAYDTDLENNPRGEIIAEVNWLKNHLRSLEQQT